MMLQTNATLIGRSIDQKYICWHGDTPNYSYLGTYPKHVVLQNISIHKKFLTMISWHYYSREQDKRKNLITSSSSSIPYLISAFCSMQYYHLNDIKSRKCPFNHKWLGSKFFSHIHKTTSLSRTFAIFSFCT